LRVPLPEFLPIDIGVCYLAATRPRRTSVPAAALALATVTVTVTGWTVVRALPYDPVQGPTALIVALSGLVAWLSSSGTRSTRTGYTRKQHAPRRPSRRSPPNGRASQGSCTT